MTPVNLYETNLGKLYAGIMKNVWSKHKTINSFYLNDVIEFIGVYQANISGSIGIAIKYITDEDVNSDHYYVHYTNNYFHVYNDSIKYHKYCYRYRRHIGDTKLTANMQKNLFKLFQILKQAGY